MSTVIPPPPTVLPPPPPGPRSRTVDVLYDNGEDELFGPFMTAEAAEACVVALAARSDVTSAMIWLNPPHTQGPPSLGE